MPMQRQTARKVRIVDIVSGEWVKKEGMEPSYVIAPSKEQIARAHIYGTVVAKFTSEDGNFASITLDDSTATLRAKIWREIDLLNTVAVGDLVSLIGKVREYDGEIYIVPELVKKITPDEESLGRLEILKSIKKRSGAPMETKPAAPMPAQKPTPTPKPEPSEQPEVVDLGPDNTEVTAEDAQTPPEPKAPEQKMPGQQTLQSQAENEEPDLRKRVLKYIEAAPEGIKYSDLMQQAGAPEEQLEAVVNELLGEGICYEPTPGKIKKI